MEPSNIYPFLLTRAFDGLKKRIANNFLSGLYECFAVIRVPIITGILQVWDQSRNWHISCHSGLNLRLLTAVEGFTVNSSHVSFFSLPFLRSLALSPPYSVFLSLCVVILPEVQV